MSLDKAKKTNNRQKDVLKKRIDDYIPKLNTEAFLKAFNNKDLTMKEREEKYQLELKRIQGYKKYLEKRMKRASEEKEKVERKRGPYKKSAEWVDQVIIRLYEEGIVDKIPYFDSVLSNLLTDYVEISADTIQNRRRKLIGLRKERGRVSDEQKEKMNIIIEENKSRILEIIDEERLKPESLKKDIERDITKIYQSLREDKWQAKHKHDGETMGILKDMKESVDKIKKSINEKDTQKTTYKSKSKIEMKEDVLEELERTARYVRNELKRTRTPEDVESIVEMQKYIDIIRKEVDDNW